MSVKPIRMFGDPVLRNVASPVDTFDASLRRLVKDLVDTLADAAGAGLAAPQIGVPLRAFAFVDFDDDSPTFGEIRHIVNPVLRDASDEIVLDEEGCLSIPGLAYQLGRPGRIVADGFDELGEPITVVGSNRLARCLAHETDHLDGVLFIDRLEPELRKRALAEIREMQLAGERVVVKRSPHPPMIG